MLTAKQIQLVNQLHKLINDNINEIGDSLDTKKIDFNIWPNINSFSVTVSGHFMDKHDLVLVTSEDNTKV